MAFTTTFQRTIKLIALLVAMIAGASLVTSGVNASFTSYAGSVPATTRRPTEALVSRDTLSASRTGGMQRYFRAGSIPMPVARDFRSPVEPEEHSAMLFGVYPGGGNGEIGSVPPPDVGTVIARLEELSDGRPFDIHLYTAWSWHSDQHLDDEIVRYTEAGYHVSLTIKYSPPDGREGDVDGYTDFVRAVVRRYAANPLVHQFIIGNEINVANGNPGASDGPFDGVREATVAGVAAAAEELGGAGSSARVGISLAVLERETDTRFLSEISRLGGTDFTSAVSFLGLNVYPGLWPVGTGDPYGDLAGHLEDARAALRAAGFDDSVGIVVLENGYPTADETLQEAKLTAFLRAVCDAESSAGVDGYSWFNLWDADSSAETPYAHYGLLRSDMSKKGTFIRYQELIASGCK
ncbi:MAG: hypothetical protein R3A46_14450 [Thermomicrobiales bacterium]